MLPDNSESTVLPTKVGDFGVFARIQHAEFHHAGNLLTESEHNACSGCSGPFRSSRSADQRPLARQRAFLLRNGKREGAIADGQVLQLTFATLIANRAIERVVNQQKFHHAFCALTALSLFERTIMPLVTGVAHAGRGFGAFSLRPDTCGNWPQWTVSCDSKNAGCTCQACWQRPSPCCLLAPRLFCRQFRFQPWLYFYAVRFPSAPDVIKCKSAPSNACVRCGIQTLRENF